jgi:hypothetical protein
MKRAICNAVFVSVTAIVFLFFATTNGTAQPQPYRLTLQDAIEKGLQANVNILLAGTRVGEDQGARERSLSAALLPRFSAQVYANYQNRDLRAFGISVPGLPLPNVVGPFSNYDFRIYAQQNVVDLASYRAFKASERSVDAGRMDERDTRDLIVRVIAGLYLNVQSAQARALAARSRVTDSTPTRPRCSNWPGTSTMPEPRPASTFSARKCSSPTISRDFWKLRMNTSNRSSPWRATSE